jgi:hypothetical protein
MLRDAWRWFLRWYIADDVPDEMDVCLDCDETECPEERYKTCPRRLASAERLRQAQKAMSGQGDTQAVATGTDRIDAPAIAPPESH